MMHVAGPMRDGIQYCSNCGAVLKDFRKLGWGSPYPTDACVEVQPGWQALDLVAKSVTCTFSLRSPA